MSHCFKVIMLCLALSCSSLTGWAAERFPFVGEVNTDKVSIRAGYDVNFERIDILPKGTSVLVISENYGWYKIQLPATAKAFVRVDYVKPVLGKVAQINADRLNIRAGRGVNFSPVGQLNKGVYVRLVSKFDDWFQIEPVEGLYGWIKKDFISIKSYTVPPLDQLGLTPVTLESAGEAERVAAQTDSGSGNAFAVNGMITPVSDASLKNIQYQLISDDKTVYFLKIDPAVVKDFTRKAVRVEGATVVDPVLSLPHPVVAVKKFSLIL